MRSLGDPTCRLVRNAETDPKEIGLEVVDWIRID
jgi:hypothetical protein